MNPAFTSDTPRTDAFVGSSPHYAEYLELIEHARQLERSLNWALMEVHGARAANIVLRDQLDELLSKHGRIDVDRMEPPTTTISLPLPVRSVP